MRLSKIKNVTFDFSKSRVKVLVDGQEPRIIDKYSIGSFLADIDYDRNMAHHLYSYDHTYDQMAERLYSECIRTGIKTIGKPKSLIDKLEATNPDYRLWKELKQKHPDAVIILRNGDFYECYDADAKDTAEACNLILSYRDGLEMVGFPHHAIDKYLPKIIRHGHRVALCDRL